MANANDGRAFKAVVVEVRPMDQAVEFNDETLHGAEIVIRTSGPYPLDLVKRELVGRLIDLSIPERKT